MDKWKRCKHQQILPTGDYILRLERDGLAINRHFHVNAKEKQREIPYFYVVAYFMVPEFNAVDIHTINQ